MEDQYSTNSVTGSKNPLDVLISSVEDIDMDHDWLLNELKEEIEDVALSIYKKMQDLNASADDSSLDKSVYVNGILRNLFDILDSSPSNDRLELLLAYLNTIDQILSDGVRCSMDDFVTLAEDRFRPHSIKLFRSHSALPKPPKQSLKKRIRFAFKELMFVGDVYRKSHRDRDIPCEWVIEIKISNKREHKGLHTLWFLFECIDQIKGTRMELDKLSKGSIIARIRLFINNKETKAEVTRFFESVRKFAHGRLSKDYQESEKLKCETEKIGSEKKLIEQELTVAQSPETIRRTQLELERLELQNEMERIKIQDARLELALKELSLTREKKKTLRELLADDIISNEDFIMLMNDLVYIKKTGNTLDVGESLDAIDRKSKRLKKDNSK